MNLESTLGVARAERVTATVVACAQEAYAENAARFSEELGDNNMTFATCVVHNLRHLVEESLVDEPGFRIEHPDGSFVVRSGRHVIHLYKGRLGSDASIEIRFDQTRTKRSLVTQNTNQLSLFDDRTIDLMPSGEAHVVFVHAGNELDGLRAIWVGAPVETSATSFRWLWHEQVYGDDLAVLDAPHDQTDVSPWGDVELPDLVINIRERSPETESGSSTPAS
jgi:hypothetical protein